MSKSVEKNNKLKGGGKLYFSGLFIKPTSAFTTQSLLSYSFLFHVVKENNTSAKNTKADRLRNPKWLFEIHKVNHPSLRKSLLSSQGYLSTKSEYTLHTVSSCVSLFRLVLHVPFDSKGNQMTVSEFGIDSVSVCIWASDTGPLTVCLQLFMEDCVCCDYILCMQMCDCACMRVYVVQA